jgi:hypothetical protein
MSTSYIAGQKKAFLAKEQIDSMWGQREPNRNLVNAAFALYYNAYRRATTCPDIHHRTKMLADLLSCAQEGWAVYPCAHDLEDAFEHLEANGGRWVEDDLWWVNYSGAQCTGVVVVPYSICNFLTAVDKRGRALGNEVRNYDQYARELVDARRNNRWPLIGNALEGIAQAAEAAKPLLWIMSVQRCEAMTEGFEKLGKYVDAVGKIHFFLDRYASSLAHNRVSGQEAAASAAFAAALACVPIVGDYFSRAVAMVPDLLQWARNIKARRDECAAMTGQRW